MSSETTQEMEAGWELNKAVAEEIMGWVPIGPSSLGRLVFHAPTTAGHFTRTAPDYSTDLAAAWEVHRAMCERLFSVRQRYFAALAESIRSRIEASVAWPDLLMYLEPVDICRAALAAVRNP